MVEHRKNIGPINILELRFQKDNHFTGYVIKKTPLKLYIFTF